MLVGLLHLTSPPQIPAGFVPVEEREAFTVPRPSSDWHVSLVGDDVLIESRTDWIKHWEAEQKGRTAKPGTVRVQLSNATASWELDSGTKVEDGWIQGFSAGEFGGGLYWFSSNGGRSKLIDGDNTDLVANLSGNVYAVQSLTHLMFWYSRLVQVVRKPQGWGTKFVTDLHVSPVAVVSDAKRFLLLTENYLSTLEPDGRQKEIFRWVFHFDPGTMVRRKDGEVWIAGERAVVRLTPEAGGKYVAQWFVHP